MNNFLKNNGRAIHITFNVLCIIFLATYIYKLHGKMGELKNVCEQHSYVIQQQHEQIGILTNNRRPSVPEKSYVRKETPHTPSVHIDSVMGKSPPPPPVPKSTVVQFTDTTAYLPSIPEEDEDEYEDEYEDDDDIATEEELDKVLDEELKQMNM